MIPTTNHMCDKTTMFSVKIKTQMNYTKLNYLLHILSLSLALIWLWIHNNVMTPKCRQNQLHAQGSCVENKSQLCSTTFGRSYKLKITDAIQYRGVWVGCLSPFVRPLRPEIDILVPVWYQTFPAKQHCHYPLAA